MINFKPLFDRVLIQREIVEEKTAGGIILAEESKENMRPHIGNVLAIGEKVEKVKISDRVYYSKYAGLEIELDKNGYREIHF